jgi:uncharacterized protein involved in outer membrane biogenesis
MASPSIRNRLLVALALLVVAAVVGQYAVRSLSFDALRPGLEARLSEALGVEVHLAGDLHLELIPWPGLEASDVRVANVPGRPSPDLLRIGTLKLGINPLRLVQRVVEIHSLRISDAELHLETDAEGTLAFPADPEARASEARASVEEDESGGEYGSIPLRIDGLYLDDVRVFYRGPAPGPVRSLRFATLSLEADGLEGPVAVLARGEFEGGRFDLSGNVGAVKELFEPTRPYPIALRGHLFDTELEAEGSIATPTTLQGVDIRFSARIPNLAELLRGYEPDLPPLGPATASGRLRHRDGSLGVYELDLEGSPGGTGRIEARGSIRDLADPGGVDLQIEVDLTDTRVIQPLVERPLPEGTLGATLHVSDPDGSLGVRGKAQGGFPGVGKIELDGGCTDLRQRAGLDVRATLRSNDLDALGKAAGFPHGLPGLPVAVAARIQGSFERVGLDDIDARVGTREGTWVEVTGSVRDVVDLRGADLSIELGAADARDLAKYLGRDVPDVGPLHGATAFHDRDGTLGLEGVAIRGGDGEVLQLEIAGDFDDLRERNGIAFELRMQTRDLAIVGAALGTNLPEVGPVEFAGNVQGSDERLRSQGTLRLNRTRFSGDWSASFAPKRRPSVTARVTSPHVYLMDLGVGSPPPGPVKRAVRREQTQIERWWSGAEPAPFETLRALDLDVEIAADRISGTADLELQDVASSIRLDQGELEIHNTGSRHDKGDMEIRLGVDARGPRPRASLSAEAWSVDLSKLASQVEKNPTVAGLLDLSIQLQTSGSNGREILSNLNGELETMLHGGTLVGSYGHQFMRTFLKLTVPSLLTLKANHDPLRCVVAVLSFDRGVGTVERMFLGSPDIDVVGTGRIDLPENALDLRLTPHVRKPGVLSVAATVDVSGPLNAPRLRAQRSSLAKSAGRALFWNALRPARIIRWPWHKEGADPCEAIGLEHAAPTGGATGVGRSRRLVSPR